jgi:hypothetical protein
LVLFLFGGSYETGGALIDIIAVIPGHAKREPQMCNCTSGNLEIPGLVLRTILE